MPGAPLINIASLVLFTGFLLLSAAVAWRGAHPPRVRVFIGYALVASFGAGLTQRDLWPFAAWPLLAFEAPDQVEMSRWMAVDDRGVEHAIDYRAWQPVVVGELESWTEVRFPTLDAATRDAAAQYLLDRAEGARRNARAGNRFAHADRFGPLTAPSFQTHVKIWTSPGEVPPRPFVGLWLYSDEWDVEERDRDSTQVVRRRIYTYPRVGLR